MNNSIVTSFDWFFLISGVFIIIMFVHQAWCNLVYVKVSKFSLDAFLVWFFLKYGNARARNRISDFQKTPGRIMMFGIYALMVVVGDVYQLFLFLKDIFG